MNRFKFWPIFAVLLAINLTASAQIVNSPAARTNHLSAPVMAPTNYFFIASNSAPEMAGKKVNDISSLPPGVYLTKPYTCMVMVPGAQHDDCCINSPAVPVPPMPVIRPELKTVPLGRPGE